MKNTQSQSGYEIGMVGLGVMGRNFLLNMADHGFSVAGYDKDLAKVAALREEAQQLDARGAADIKEFIALLRRPRAIMLLVPAGAPVDSVIKDLLPHLDKGDLIIDAGNSHFTDTDVRARNLTGLARAGRDDLGRDDPRREGGMGKLWDVERRAVEPTRQHLDRDAARWVEPAANFSVVEPTAFETRLAPAGPLLPKHVFSDSLYNRPPPSPGILL